MKHLLLLLIPVTLVSCTTYEKEPFEASAVSMTISKLPVDCMDRGKKVKEVWCENDQKQQDAAGFGLFDQVILMAQKKHQVDVLLDSKLLAFEKDGLACARIDAFLPAPCKKDSK